MSALDAALNVNQHIGVFVTVYRVTMNTLDTIPIYRTNLVAISLAFCRVSTL